VTLKIHLCTAQLPQRDRVTRYVSKCVLCVSRSMGARQVSNSKSDLQGHSRALAMVSVVIGHTYDLTSIATVSLPYTISQILSLISQNFKRLGYMSLKSPIPEHTLSAVYHSIMHYSILLYQSNEHTTFEVPIFYRRQRYYWGKIKKRVTWPWPFPLGSSLSCQWWHLIYSTCITVWGDQLYILWTLGIITQYVRGIFLARLSTFSGFIGEIWCGRVGFSSHTLPWWPCNASEIILE